MDATTSTKQPPLYDPDALDSDAVQYARSDIEGSNCYFTCPFDTFRDAYCTSPVTDGDVKNCIRELTMTGKGKTPMLKKKGRGYQFLGCASISREWQEPVEDRSTRKRKRSEFAQETGKPVRDPRTCAVRAYAPLFDIMKAVYSFGAKSTPTPTNHFDVKQHPHELYAPRRFHLAEGCIAEPEWDDELAMKIAAASPSKDGRNYRNNDGRFYCVPTGRVAVPIACCNTKARNAFDIMGIVAQTVLQKDRRRTWVYGVTIELENVYLWLFTRSFVIKTEPINWVEDAHEFIRLFLILARSSPKQLGFDPYVHRVPGTYDFIYEVKPTNDTEDGDAGAQAANSPAQPHPSFFKTVVSIVGPNLGCITGRTTRITKVIQVHSVENPTPVVDGQYAILKDIWLDSTVSSEIENQERMFAAVDAFIAQPDWKSDRRLKDFDAKMMGRLEYLFTNQRYRGLFLTKLHAWKGMEYAPLCRDAVYVPQFDNYGQQFGQPQIHKALYKPKRQSRIIYAEVCTPMTELSTLGEVINIIAQATTALQVLFCAGWVHRDIAEGNLMAYRSSEGEAWTLKLADFEFAVEFSGVDERTIGYKEHVKIGTAAFMPLETAGNKYAFQRLRVPPGLDAPTLAHQLRATGNAAGALSRFKPLPREVLPAEDLKALLHGPSVIPDDANFCKIPPPESTHIVHNYQHDLESLWWVTLYFLAIRVHHAPGLRISRKMFREHTVARHNMFWKGHPGDDLWPFHPDLQKAFSSLMNETRKKMVLDTYLRPTMGQFNVPSSYSAVHAVFAKCFDEVTTHGGDQEWVTMQVDGQ